MQKQKLKEAVKLLGDADILELRPFLYYHSDLPYLHDLDYWHNIGIRIGES